MTRRDPEEDMPEEVLEDSDQPLNRGTVSHTAEVTS